MGGATSGSGRARRLAAGTLPALLTLALTLAFAVPARAGGIELPGPGTRGLGRGAANLASIPDPLAVWLNPARLPDIAGQVLLDVDLVNYDLCVQRYGTYGDGVSASDLDRVSRFGRLGDYADEPFPRVCRRETYGVLPWFLASARPHPRVGFGFGLVAPVSSGSNRFGRLDGSIRGVTGEDRPIPTRYATFDQDTSLVRLVAGVGYRPHRKVSLGLTYVHGIHWGSATSYVLVIPNQAPSRDVRSSLSSLHDWWVPGFVAAVQVSPLDALDIALTAQWSRPIHSRGNITLTFGDVAADQDPSMPAPRTTIPSVTGPLEGASLHVPQSMSFRLAMRYADRLRAPDPTGARAPDPMTDERFDVELVVGLEHTSHIDRFTVRAPPGHTLDIIEVSGDGTVSSFEAPVREVTELSKGFRDQLTLYLGGDAQAVPGTLALRGGLSFETSGMKTSLAQPDFLPTRRVGLHAGLTVRLAEVDLSFAYGHFFQETVSAGLPGDAGPTAAFRAPVSIGTGPVVNAGRYSASWDLWSLGFRYRFE